MHLNPIRGSVAVRLFATVEPKANVGSVGQWLERSQEGGSTGPFRGPLRRKARG